MIRQRTRIAIRPPSTLGYIDAIHVRRNHAEHAVSKGYQEKHEGKVNSLEDYETFLRVLSECWEIMKTFMIQ